MSATVTLDHPVEVKGETHTILAMRRAKVRDRLAAVRAGGGDEDKEIRLFANLCEVAPEVIEELDEADYAKLQQAYLGFTSGVAASPARPL